MKAVIVFSGGLDSVSIAAMLKKKFEIYAITFSYGQKANKETRIAKKFAELLKFKEHKIVNISFMKDLYANTNALTNDRLAIPSEFHYSVVVPIRNAVFLTIASAWAFSKKAELVAYGAHVGDKKYPDCRPVFSNALTRALNAGEIDGINLGLRKKIKIWSPFVDNLSKYDLVKTSYKEIGDLIFKSWSCYNNTHIHCGKCESCNNRKISFTKSGIRDKTRYLKN